MPILISKSHSASSYPSPDRSAKLRGFLLKEARELGFSLVGITAPASVSQAGRRLEQAISLGFHGSMIWMEETLERRKNPANLWGDVRSIIMLGLNYGPDDDPRTATEHKNCAAISVYARHRDYHDLIKGRLKQLGNRFVSYANRHMSNKLDVKVFVDTAPVMEKPLAAAAGLGWQGKHSNLVAREFGSWLFLGAIFTTAELAPDMPERDHCGTCRACLDACPTQAFPAPYQLDARRCISYLTIELKEQIPLEFRSKIGNRVYGCDDCLAVCPWNKFARATYEIKLQARDALKNPHLRDLLQLDDAAFRAFFLASPIKRIGRNRFIRNVLVACGNSGDKSLIADIMPHLGDDCGQVRGMAVWALKQLLLPQDFAHLHAHCNGREKDLNVQLEWSLS